MSLRHSINRAENYQCDSNKTWRILIGLLVKTRRLAHIFDWYYKGCTHFSLEKKHCSSFKYFFSLWWKFTPLIFDSYFLKVPILSFLVFHFAAFCWSKMFSISFLSISRLYFFFTWFLSRRCYCTVSTCFQISYNNFLPNKQTNGNR